MTRELHPRAFKERERYSRVLRVPYPERIDERILRLFERYGYRISEGEFRESNPNEIGLYARPKLYESGRRKNQLAQIGGIELPQGYSGHEIIGIDKPIVAKSCDHAGEGKFLLSVREQKVKFVTFALLGEKVRDLYKLSEPEKLIGSLFGIVERGDFLHRWLNEQTINRDWCFEEYVESPSDYNVTFRLVTDCWGNLVYAKMGRSLHRKDEKKLVSKRKDDNPLETVGIDKSVPMEYLLVHPRSPFFLDTYDITTYLFGDSSNILLNGKRVVDSVDRDVLVQFGVDPDNPYPANDMLVAAQKIGSACRGDYYCVGTDMLKDKKLRSKYLESNFSPEHNAEALGLPESTTQIERQLEVAKRVISFC